MGTLVLIRHGQASYGQADYDRLSDRGHEQARVLGAFLASQRLDHIYVGPLRRQQQTAETAGVLAEATTLAELAEYPAFDLLQHFMPKLVAEDPRFADLATRPSRELANDAFHTMLGKWSRDEWRVEGVEHVGAFAERVRRGLDQMVRDAASGARIAVITSAGPIGVAVGLTFGASSHHMVRTSTMIRNASITELKFRSENFDWHPERVSLLSFNSIHHLPPELHTEY